MSENPRDTDPSLLSAATDPTLQGGSTQNTLAECPPETRAALEGYMAARRD